MKSIFKILFILTTCALLIHATNQRCTSCGNLGEGKNPCTCSDVVVKAAQLPKPTYYALPQQINEAAAARRGISLSTSQSTISSSAQVDSNSTPCSSSSLSIDSNADIVINGKSDSTSYSSSSSSDTSGSIVAYDNVATVTDTITESQSGGCGCSKQTIETVEIDDSQSSNGEIVPSFPPIGDLCYPLPVDSRTGKIIEKTTKVVPAYPGKIVCQNCMSSRTTPYQVCINSLTGEILSTKIISSSSDATSESGTLIYENSNSAITGLDALPIPSETISKSRTLIYGNSNPTISGLDTLSIPSETTSKSGTLIYENSNSAISGLDALSIPSETISKSGTLIYGNSNSAISGLGALSSPSETISKSGTLIYGNSNSAIGDLGALSSPSETISKSRTLIYGNSNPTISGLGALSSPLDATSKSGTLIYGNSNSAISGLGALSSPSETISKSRTLIYGNSNPTISGLGALSSPLDATSKSGTLIYGNSNSAISGLGALSSPSETISKSRTLIYGNSNPTISASGPFIQIAPGKNGVVSQSRSFSGPRVTLHKNANSGVFGGASSTPYKLPLVYANLNSPNRQKQRSRITLSRSSSDCFDDSATTGGTEVDYSYPAIPADAVSLTLAYKNLRAPNVIYRQGKQFIPEDKLSFGHRTVPNEVKTQTKISNIPEEKLVTVDRPVVELKVAPARTVVIGSYDEREEAKLAELEAFERESITQEENVDRVSESLLTYKDLGYAPVGSTYTQFAKYNGAVSYNGEMSDSGEAPCGPLGPPLSDYVPGRVVVQQEVVQDNAETSFNGGINESMEIIQSSRSGSCPT